MARRAPDGTIAGWTFRGAGWGHGVGLCQSGARGAALAGLNYRQILAHYFRQTAVVKLYR
jgi:SpoIID/LytB domain protein